MSTKQALPLNLKFLILIVLSSVSLLVYVYVTQ